MYIIGVLSGYFPEPTDVKYKGDRLRFSENSGIAVDDGREYIEEIP
jgi:hypothetical protein